MYESFWARHWSPWQLVIIEGNGDFDRLSLFCDYSPRDPVMRCCNDAANLLKQPISFIDEGQSSFYRVRAKIFILFFFIYFFFLILFIIYISLSFRQTLKELTESLSSSLFRGPIRALYAGTVLKRRQRFLSDLSISLWVTLCLPAVTARFLASSNDSSSISARTVERMASAFFEMMYVWSAWSKEVRDPRV